MTPPNGLRARIALRTARGRQSPTSGRTRRTQRLAVEPLEDRLTPSGYLLVANYDTNSVLRFDEVTGAPAPSSPGSSDATFVSKNTGGLYEPMGLVFGPQDHNLYVSSGFFGGKAGNGHPNAVMRYDGTAGGPMPSAGNSGAVFANNGNLTSTRGVVFGPDGNLYVADGTGTTDGTVVVYDGTTGAFIKDLFSRGTGGLSHPQGLVFGPDGLNDGKLDLYVSSAFTNSILRYDGTTGSFIDAFVPSGSGGLDHPIALTFGPDGNLYVVSFGLHSGIPTVMRFDGTTGGPMPSAGNSGAVFVAGGFGGLLTPTGLIFGPDGKNDGGQDLYVTNADIQNLNRGKDSTILRYDVTGAPAPSSGNTGATFIAANSGGLDNATYLIFTETDPTTLAYNGATIQSNAAAPETSARITNLTSATVLMCALPDLQSIGDGWPIDPMGLARQRVHHTSRS
jgi:hypothetical protein